MSPKNSKARIDANNRYNDKAYDRINVAIPKGRKATVEAYAKARGESVNGLVNTLLRDAVGLSETEWKMWTVHITEKADIINPDTGKYHDTREALIALDGLHEADIEVIAESGLDAIGKAREQYTPVFRSSSFDCTADPLEE